MGWNYLSIHKLQRLHRWSLRMDKQFHPTFYNGCNYLSMLGLKLNHVSKRGHWYPGGLIVFDLIPIPGSTWYMAEGSVRNSWAWPWFSIKMSSYQYRKSHFGDKTILQPFYLHNGISYTGKMISLYWIGPLLSTILPLQLMKFCDLWQGRPSRIAQKS